MDNFYQQTALDVYLQNVKRKAPRINEHELKLLEAAFITGFNVGCADNSVPIVQEFTLRQLSK